LIRQIKVLAAVSASEFFRMEAPFLSDRSDPSDSSDKSFLASSASGEFCPEAQAALAQKVLVSSRSSPRLAAGHAVT